MPDVIVLFDGVCNFCNGAVRFIIRRDPRGRFRFASLQSDVGRRLLEQQGFADVSPETIVLIDDDGCHTRSTAVLRICRNLSGLWPMLTPLGLIPRSLRDAVYAAFARRRYRWFGELPVCPVPPPEIADRFLDAD